jgi:hypothetical protein
MHYAHTWAIADAYSAGTPLIELIDEHGIDECRISLIVNELADDDITESEVLAYAHAEEPPLWHDFT